MKWSCCRSRPPVRTWRATRLNLVPLRKPGTFVCLPCWRWQPVVLHRSATCFPPALCDMTVVNFAIWNPSAAQPQPMGPAGPRTHEGFSLHVPCIALCPDLKISKRLFEQRQGVPAIHQGNLRPALGVADSLPAPPPAGTVRCTAERPRCRPASSCPHQGPLTSPPPGRRRGRPASWGPRE